MSPTPQHGCVVERLFIQSPTNARIELGRPGILCIGVLASEGTPALLVIADEGAQNEGASATNAAEIVLAYLDEAWRGTFAVREANVVEFDSEACFDHVQVQWQGHGDPKVLWQPLRWAGVPARSRAAFYGMFGAQAKRAAAAVGMTAPANFYMDAPGSRE